MSKFSQKRLDQIWDKGATIRGKNPDLYRKDIYGNTMFKPSYGKTSEMGWNVDHSKYDQDRDEQRQQYKFTCSKLLHDLFLRSSSSVEIPYDNQKDTPCLTVFGSGVSDTDSAIITEIHLHVQTHCVK